VRLAGPSGVEVGGVAIRVELKRRGATTGGGRRRRGRRGRGRYRRCGGRWYRGLRSRSLPRLRSR
jgi:hypothetical protein